MSLRSGSVTPPGPRGSADFSYAIAREYGSHTDGDNNATTSYVRAETHEVAAALAALTGALTRGVGGSDVTPPEPQRVERAIRRKVNQAPATAVKRTPFARCHLLIIRCRSELSKGTAPCSKRTLTVRTRYPVKAAAAAVFTAAAAIMRLSPPDRQPWIRAAVVATRVNGATGA
jgi:hypothetical protein